MQVRVQNSFNARVSVALAEFRLTLVIKITFSELAIVESTPITSPATFYCPPNQEVVSIASSRNTTPLSPRI